MNQRFRQLAEQVEWRFADRLTGEFSEYDKRLIRFAELIVRECIEQGDTLAKHYIDTHPEQEQVMLLAAISDYSKEIKKHFGVEE